MKNKLFLYNIIIFLCFKTLVPIEHIHTITKKTAQSIGTYLEPCHSEAPSTAFMYNINIIFDYYLKSGNHPNNTSSNKVSLQYLCNFPTINLLIQIINQVYPLSRFTLLSNNPIAITTGYEFFKLANKIFPNESKIEYNLLKSILPLCICSFAFYNDPSLFTNYTYVSLFDFFNDYIMTIPIPSKILYPVLQFYHTLFHDEIIKHYVIKKINYIFDAKKAMFLYAIILACFNIKLKKNTLFTNPLYWLPIGLMHFLFTQYQWSTASSNSKIFLDQALLLEIMEKFNLTENHNFSNVLLKYTVHNAIPFGVVLCNVIYSFVKK